MSPRPNVSEERTAQIIEAAMTVFSREGFNKARMDDIAKESKLSKGTLYLYFKSKDAIIRTILNAIIGRELAHARELVESDRQPEEKLHLFAQIMIKDLKRIKPLLSLYFEFLALSMRREVIRNTITQTFEEFIVLLENLIQQGIDAGVFRQVDVRDAALAVGAIFEGTILLWAYDPDWIDFEKHIDTGLDLLLEGLKA